ncbi:hypothetical protein BV898_10517 [Hypsibius exemplaris]|uniref:Uncharacterized protein n=1 Tax=Hypsibius exemplaris TaxID=2072580 RepID=A0A1W0WJB4_HYPEX|nr:hypothetical protein BV898_10517 [Hypsibius exemplaris]
MAKFNTALLVLLLAAGQAYAAKEILENAEAITEWMQQQEETGKSTTKGVFSYNVSVPRSGNTSNGGLDLNHGGFGPRFDPAGPRSDSAGPRFDPSGPRFDPSGLGLPLLKGDRSGNKPDRQQQTDSGNSERSNMDKFSAAFPKLILQQIMEGKPIKVTLERESKLVFQRKVETSSAITEGVLLGKSPATTAGSKTGQETSPTKREIIVI